MMLSKSAFDAVTEMFHSVSGIRLTEAKRALVTGRLQKLAQQRGLPNVDAYVEQLLNGGDKKELVQVIDKLTTNETYFFREPQHFEFLKSLLTERLRNSSELRIWSAASSSGEEAYSIAMLLADSLGLKGWQVIGTDLSTAMVQSAQRGLYPLERAKHVPPEYLKKWCLKGEGEYDGKLLVARELRQRVRFLPGNLKQDLPDIGLFDVIFLRNVLIYFDNEGKTDIVNRVLTKLKPDGFLFTGHAESLTNLGLPVRALASAIYVHA